ncbi:hypothetical protein BC829DRAFT_407079 [Chytridium lagenaria]|nr:hypothetical protein BC829DRAFT_407079 [Chytridium lagenaria]
MQHQGNGGSLYGPPAGMQPPVMQRTSSPNSEATAPSASNSNHPHQGYPQYNYAGPLNPGQLNFPEHSHQYAHQHPHQHPHPQSAPQPIPQSHQHPVHPMPMHHSPVPAPHPHLQGSPSFHHEPDRKGSLASNVKSTGQAMFNKFWSLGRSLSMSEASLTVTHGDAPPSYSSSVRTESSTTKSGPLFPSHLQDVPLKSGPLFGLHSTISSGTGTISSSGSLSSNTSSRGIIRSGSKAADVLNYDPANPPLVFSIRRNGLRFSFRYNTC